MDSEQCQRFIIIIMKCNHNNSWKGQNWLPRIRVVIMFITVLYFTNSHEAYVLNIHSKLYVHKHVFSSCSFAMLIPLLYLFSSTFCKFVDCETLAFDYNGCTPPIETNSPFNCFNCLYISITVPLYLMFVLYFVYVSLLYNINCYKFQINTLATCHHSAKS